MKSKSRKGHTADRFGQHEYRSQEDSGATPADLDNSSARKLGNKKEGLRTASRSVHVDGTSIADAKAHGVSRTAKGSSDAEQPDDSFLQK
jgi:hypothetical protein